MTETKTLAAALSLVQAKLPVIHKGSTAIVKTKAGGEYKYGYANLADMAPVVYPLLGEFGLAFVCVPTLRNNVYMLVGRLEHTSGETRSGVFPLPRDTDPQTLGSAMTYGRRYLLGCLTGVVTGDEDDDGAQATRVARGERARTGAAQSARRTRDVAPADRAPVADQPTDAQLDHNAQVAAVLRVGQAIGLAINGLKDRYRADHGGELTDASTADLATFERELRSDAGGE